MAEAKTMTTKEVAEELETDSRTLRKFLRSKTSPITPVGQGNRYSIQRGQIKVLKKAFLVWRAPRTERRPETAGVEEPEVLEIDDE